MSDKPLIIFQVLFFHTVMKESEISYTGTHLLLYELTAYCNLMDILQGLFWDLGPENLGAYVTTYVKFK